MNNFVLWGECSARNNHRKGGWAPNKPPLSLTSVRTTTRIQVPTCTLQKHLHFIWHMYSLKAVMFLLSMYAQTAVYKHSKTVAPRLNADIMSKVHLVLLFFPPLFPPPPFFRMKMKVKKGLKLGNFLGIICSHHSLLAKRGQLFT